MHFYVFRQSIGNQKNAVRKHALALASMIMDKERRAIT
jgi:hypothetical protein